MQIADIFHTIKRDFKYVTDRKQYGVDEKWVMPDGVKIEGDCEDFALACRALCRANDIQSRLILCNVETGEMHCVLESKGYILDNRMKEVKKIDDLPYRWLAMSGYEKGEDWRAIDVC